MAQRKKIEVFSAGCHTCREAVEIVSALPARITTSKYWTCTRTTWPQGRDSMASAACRAWWWTAILPRAALAVGWMRRSCDQRSPDLPQEP